MYTLYASCACTERQAIFRYNQTEVGYVKLRCVESRGSHESAYMHGKPNHHACNFCRLQAYNITHL